MKLKNFSFPDVRFREGDRVRISVPKIFSEIEPCQHYAEVTGTVIGSRCRLAEFRSEDVTTKPMDKWEHFPHIERLYFVAFDQPTENGLTETETPVPEFWLSLENPIVQAIRNRVRDRQAVA